MLIASIVSMVVSLYLVSSGVDQLEQRDGLRDFIEEMGL